MTATATSRDQCSEFAQAVADYCYDQEQRAKEANDDGGIDRWGAAMAAADDLSDALRDLAGDEER